MCRRPSLRPRPHTIFKFDGISRCHGVYRAIPVHLGSCRVLGWAITPGGGCSSGHLVPASAMNGAWQPLWGAHREFGGRAERGDHGDRASLGRARGSAQGPHPLKARVELPGPRSMACTSRLPAAPLVRGRGRWGRPIKQRDAKREERDECGHNHTNICPHDCAAFIKPRASVAAGGPRG